MIWFCILVAALCALVGLIAGYGIGHYQAHVHPKLEFDCTRDRHMWSTIEKVPGVDVHWYQGRHCQLCNLQQILDSTGAWEPSMGLERKR
jgi:hypothetical protein